MFAMDQKWSQFTYNYIYNNKASQQHSHFYSVSSILQPDIFINLQQVLGEVVLVRLRNLLKKIRSPARRPLCATCRRP